MSQLSATDHPLAVGGEPILRPSLHDQLLRRIRDMIISGQLRPDSKIDEKELGLRFGVSRTPLREALKVLASEGLILLIPHRGALVAGLDMDVLASAFPVMGALEALAGELACVNATEWEIAEVARLQAQLVELHKAGALPAYFEVNRMIHELILNAARNPVLAQLYDQVSVKVRRARFTANLDPRRWAQAIDEHNQIMLSLQARDAKKLSTILRAHLDHKFETVKVAMGRGKSLDGIDKPK